MLLVGRRPALSRCEARTTNQRLARSARSCRVRADHVTYVVADLFEWQPEEQYELVFFAFWLTHVPPAQFEVLPSDRPRPGSPTGARRVSFLGPPSADRSGVRAVLNHLGHLDRADGRHSKPKEGERGHASSYGTWKPQTCGVTTVTSWLWASLTREGCVRRRVLGQ